MPADTLERLQGASEVQAVEGGRAGAAEGVEVMAASALHGHSGHSDSLALSSGQTSLPASVRRCGATAGCGQRLPH